MDLFPVFDFIRNNDFKKISLQFPDDMLSQSVQIVDQFKAEFNDLEFFIMADTSFGSCCVDEVAAQHAHSDCVIHFGHACLSPVSQLPVFYVFPKNELNSELLEVYPESALLFMDLCFDHMSKDILYKLGQKVFYCCPIFNQQFPGTEISVENFSGRRLPENIDDYSNILYLGSDESFLTLLKLRFSQKQLFILDQTTRKWTPPKSNRTLMKRLLMSEKAKSAEVIGILVGTLAVSQFTEMIQILKKRIRKAGKLCFTILVGKINPAKLANFSDIPVFVNVACSYSILVDTKDYFQTIITPYELEMALSGVDLSNYSLDFSVLNLMKEEIEKEVLITDEDEPPVFSLATGTLVSAGQKKGRLLSTETALVKKSEEEMAMITMETLLESRTWKGLDLNEMEKPVIRAVEGRNGLAKGYQNEPN